MQNPVPTENLRISGKLEILTTFMDLDHYVAKTEVCG